MTARSDTECPPRLSGCPLAGRAPESPPAATQGPSRAAIHAAPRRHGDPAGTAGPRINPSMASARLSDLGAVHTPAERRPLSGYLLATVAPRPARGHGVCGCACGCLFNWGGADGGGGG